MREAISHKKTLVAMLALAMDELIVKAKFSSRSLWLGQQGLFWVHQNLDSMVEITGIVCCQSDCDTSDEEQCL